MATSYHRSANNLALRYSTTTHMCSERSCSFKPSLRASFTSLGGGKMEMDLIRPLHFPFKPQVSGKVSADDLLNSSEMISTQDIPCSHLDTLCFGASSMLRAFDPNVCSCVDWGQPDVSYWSFTGRNFDWQMAAPPRGPSRRHLSHGYEGRQGRCLGRQHGFSSEYAMGKYEVGFPTAQTTPICLLSKRA